MMKVLKVLCLVFVFGECAKLPGTFKRCNRQDSDFKMCLSEAFIYNINQLEKSFPRIGLPSLKPLHIKELAINSTGNVVKLFEKLTNCRLFNFLDFELAKFDFDFDERVMQMGGVFKEVRTFCDYDIHGHVLGIRVYGRGKSHLVFANFNVSVTGRYEEFVKGNETYAKFKSAKVTGRPSSIDIHINNLYDGDMQLSNLVNRLISGNWFILYDDISPEYFELAGMLWLMLVNRFFAEVSLQELFDR